MNSEKQWRNKTMEEETENCIKETRCEINGQGFCDEEIICGCEGCRFYQVIYVPTDIKAMEDEK